MPSEFEAVIMAGGAGNRLYPLTRSVPKPLLPLVNRPLLLYQLQLLENSGFATCIVVTVQDIASAVTKYVNEVYKGVLRIQVEVLPTFMGTADALRRIAHKISTDFFVISGDTVTDAELHYLADTHRSRGSAFTALLQEKIVERDAPAAGGGGKGKAAKKAAEEAAKAAAKARKKQQEEEEIGLQYIGTTTPHLTTSLSISEASQSPRVLFWKSASDVSDRVTVSKYLLTRHPNLCVHRDLVDIHVYIFARWVLDLLDDKKNISSIQGELVPYLVRAQFTGSADSYVTAATEYDELVARTSHSPPPFDAAERVRCYAYIARNTLYCRRANTVARYFAMSKELPALPNGDATPWPPFSDGGRVAASRAFPKAKIHGSCVVGDGVKVGDGTELRGCIVGAHCKIGANCVLSNCVLMDYVSIEDGCELSGSIVCGDTLIQEGATVVDCQVGESFVVTAGSELRGEALCKDDDILDQIEEGAK